MRVVIDGLPITGMSLAIVVEHLLEGWEQLDVGDDVHMVIGPGAEAEMVVPDWVKLHRVPFGRRAFVSRLRAQNTVVPKLCRQLDAGVMLGVLPTTTIAPLPCPRVIITYDIRHELRPEQFTAKSRALRTYSYNIGFRQADGIACISERTRQDLLRSRPWLRNRPVEVTLLGADHVDHWPAPEPEPAEGRYALAFGQYGNKNVDLVLDAWAMLRERGQAQPLVVVGLGGGAREATECRIAELNLGSLVTAKHWLSPEEFRQCFTSAGLIVFPSDFEGFGLPAAEGMRLGKPVVITPEPALLEVSGGHASVMAGWGPAELADAVVAARSRTPEQIEAARAHIADYTWARTAAQTRDLLAAASRRASATSRR